MERSLRWSTRGGLGALRVGLLGLLVGTAAEVQAGSCTHPYFPVAPTIQRKYETTYRTGMPSFTHVERITAVTDTGFTQEIELATARFTRVWTCNPDGLSSSEPGNLSAELRMTSEKSAGVTLISGERLKPGAAWQRHYDLRGTMPVLEGSEVWGTIDIHFEVIGPGPITVPAGSYEAMKVRFAQVQRFTMKHENSEAPIHGVLKGTLWYVRDVGLVKTEIETAAVTELLAFKK